MYDTRDIQLMQETLMRYDHLINRPYLYELSLFSTITSAPSTLSIQLLQLSTFPTSTSPQYFAYILNALNGLNQTVGYIICSSPNGFSIYIGIKGASCSNIALDLLRTGILQSFPNVIISHIENPTALLSELFNPALYTLLSTATGIPAISLSASTSGPPASSPASFMKYFTNLMGSSQSYIIFFLAEPYIRCDLQEYLSKLYEVYYTLSMFSQTSHNIGEGLAKNMATTITKTDNYVDAISKNVTLGDNKSCNQGGYTNLSGSTPFLYSDTKSISVTLLKNCAKATVNAKSSSCANGNSHSDSHTDTCSKLSATNKTSNHAINFSIQNKYIQNTLETLSTHISRVQTLLTSPCFNLNTYFLSTASETSLRAAYNFSGLCQTASSSSQVNAVSYWSNTHPEFLHLLQELQHFNSPLFCNQDICYSSGTLVQSTELINCFYL